MVDVSEQIVRAAKKLGDAVPDGARMFIECERRSSLYRYPCTQRDGRKYATPDDCPYVNECDSDKDKIAVVALLKALLAARAGHD